MKNGEYLLFESIRGKKATHENAYRNGTRIGHIGITANLKNDTISFNTKILGDFESKKDHEIINEIIELSKKLEQEYQTTHDGIFVKKKGSGTFQ